MAHSRAALAELNDGHEGVADGLDLGAPVLGEQPARDAFVVAQDVAPGGVADALEELGVGLDVGEEDGLECARRLSRACRR